MAYLKIDTGRYPVHIGNIYPALASFLSEKHFSSMFLLVDENTLEHCYPSLADAIPGVESYHLIKILSGEKHKTLESCQQVWEQLTLQQADRKALMINLSGGVLSDLGGFCAASYKRGITFINIPTTLLSMVDASVGGKVGIDFLGYKNQIGLFTNPEAVFIFPEFLKTLPARQLKSGFAEMLKHGFIADKQYLNELFERDLQNISPTDWHPLIAHSVNLKNKIVKQDPKESGLRKILNFGHTIGHALESYSFSTSMPLLHGEAIAAGMMLELLLSKDLCRLDENFTADALLKLQALFPELRLWSFTVEPVMKRMLMEKKNFNGNVMMALLEAPGKAVFDVAVTSEQIEKTLLKWPLKS
jgi:3-dehydroquinate synthase